ncbi:MAK10-like protein [Tanacetum coccineum]|uniref:MAK10-like protein n=1 Tax=Tanacetum coccineum TaxID=301880 RepID=A0ABQ5FUJ2_9ASTR
MGDENPIRTLGDYSKPSHEGYKNTIELPVRNNMIPLRSDTIRLVQNGCSFHRLRSEDPNQHLKDFLKLVDSLDLDGSITTWVDLTTRFLTQFFPPGRTAKLRNDILMFQQHHGESLSEAWTYFKDLLQKVPHHGIDLWLQLRDLNAEESWALLEDLALYDNESWNDPRDFAKPVKAIALPQDVPSTSDRRLIELENQVQRLMEAHLAPTQPTQVNKITTSCEICSGPHDTQYCMEDPEQAFVEYASSRTDEAGGKWYTFKPEQNNLGDTYNPSWRSHPNLRWRQPQNSQNNFSNPPNQFQPNCSIPNRSFNNRPQSFNNQSNLEGLVSNFMASQDARLSKALSSDTVKNPKLSASLVLSARSYPTIDPQCSSHPSTLINAIKAHSKEANISQAILLQTWMGIEPQQPKEPELTLEDKLQDLHLNLLVLEVLAHASIYKAILDKYVESLELGKNRSVFFQGEVPAKMEDPKLFTLPYRLGGSKPFDTLADLDVEVHIGKLKLLNDFYVIDVKKDPETPLLVGRGFLATANAVIDCRMAKIAVGKGITSSDRVGARTHYYARKEFLDCHLPREWEIARDVELNPFNDILVFRRMVEFLGAIPIYLKCNMWESEDLIKNPINWDKQPKNGDVAWHAKIRLIDPDGEEFTKTLQSIPTAWKLSERESTREIIDLDHFYDT